MSNRNIFEDVTEASMQASAPAKKPAPSRKGLKVWLILLFVLVAAMIVVGGLTRLTDSGLAITEWNVVAGSVPPLNAADWLSEYVKYQASPEYQIINSTMTLEEFKGIYWWEWSHRFLGRFVGLVWGVGFVWFWLRKQIPTGYTGKLLILGGLGGAQGALGWWMVSSGLTGRMVDVASYRLAMHLGLAFIILGLITWHLLGLSKVASELLQARRRRESGLMKFAGVLVVVLFAQVLLGGLVAGINAGEGYPTWPSMDGQFLPSSSFDYTPLWSNFFENVALVQFNHRMMGYIVFGLGLAAWWKSRKSPVTATRGAFNVMMVMMLAQVGLGIFAVLSSVQFHVAITHQFGAIILFVLVIRARFAAAYPDAQKIARGVVG